jgi:hypothetical protein
MVLLLTCESQVSIVWEDGRSLLPVERGHGLDPAHDLVKGWNPTVWASTRSCGCGGRH